jgi:DNA-binding response OmpR family regulator
MKKNRILLVEDDLSLIDGLVYALGKQGFEAEVARTVREADGRLGDTIYDLLILDLALPDGSGFEICKKVRQRSGVPIIFLTAADEEVNIVMGLDMGGDDYITKPFKMGELISRINALLRRAGTVQAADGEIVSNGITLLPLQGQAYKEGVSLDLTAAEYKLLGLLMSNPNHILPKETILDKLWDSKGNFVDDNTLAVYIRRLRLKVEPDPDHPRMLLTVRGMGYKWKE